MNSIAIWPRESDMNALDARRETLIIRRIMDTVKIRKIAAKILAHMPKPKKGESIVHELNESRHRGGPL